MTPKMGLYRRGAIWWVTFSDHKKLQRAISSRSKVKSHAVSLYDNLKRLVGLVGSGGIIPDDIANWVNSKLDKDRRGQLIAWGLIDDRRLLAGLPLEKHLDDWQAYIERAKTAAHAEQHRGRASKIVGAVEIGLGGPATFQDLTGVRVSAALNDLGLAQSTQNGYLTAIRGFSRWMVKHGRASAEPNGLAMVERVKVTERVVIRRSLTDAERDALLSAPDPRRLSYELSLYMGLRANEIRQLTPEAFDLSRMTLHISAAIGKSKRLDSLPIPEHLVERLTARLAMAKEGERLFWSPKYTVQLWVRKDTGSDDLDFHCLRHDYCSRLARAGVHPSVAQKLMRHSDINLTMRFYTHLHLSDAVAAANLLGPVKANTKTA